MCKAPAGDKQTFPGAPLGICSGPCFGSGSCFGLCSVYMGYVLHGAAREAEKPDEDLGMLAICLWQDTTMLLFYALPLLFWYLCT